MQEKKLVLDENAKQIFLDVYNDPEVKSIQIHSVITKNLIEAGYLTEESQVLKPELVRDIFTNVFKLEYRKRPRKAVEITEIVFVSGSDSVSDTVEEAYVIEEDAIEVDDDVYRPSDDHGDSPFNF